MILSDSEIQAALQSGQIRIEPPPSPTSYTTTAVDLSLGGGDFKRWTIPPSGVDIIIDPAKPGFFANLAPYLESVPLQENALVLKPGEFILALTR